MRSVSISTLCNSGHQIDVRWVNADHVGRFCLKCSTFLLIGSRTGLLLSIISSVDRVDSSCHEWIVRIDFRLWFQVILIQWTSHYHDKYHRADDNSPRAYNNHIYKWWQSLFDVSIGMVRTCHRRARYAWQWMNVNRFIWKGIRQAVNDMHGVAVEWRDAIAWCCRMTIASCNASSQR